MLDMYDYTQLTFETLDCLRDWGVTYTQNHNIIYWRGREELCDKLVKHLNSGRYDKAVAFMNMYADNTTGHGESLYERLEAAASLDDVDLHGSADSFGIGAPAAPKQWEPDVPDPSVDLMKSIRDACTR